MADNTNSTFWDSVNDVEVEDQAVQAPMGQYLEPEAGYAGFWTSVLADMANDVDTKIKVYAQARFPNEPLDQAVSRYNITQAGNGKVIYQGDDGKLYAEQGDSLGEMFKRFGAGMLGEGPLVAAETFAAAKNLPFKFAIPVIAGGAGLNAVTKYALTGEEIDERDLYRQGLNTALGTGFHAVTRGLNARDTMLDGLEQLAPEERAAITATQRSFYEGTGVNLPLDQAAGENSGLNVLGGWLRTRIGSSDRMSRNLQEQVDQVNRLADDFARGLNRDKPVDPSVVSADAIGTAKRYEEGLTKARTEAVQKEYDDALLDGISGDDVAGAIQVLTSELPKLTSKQKALYQRYIDDLYDEITVVEKTPKLDELGNAMMKDGEQVFTEVTKKSKVPTTNMERLHNLRKELDLTYTTTGTIPANVYLQLRGQLDTVLKANPKFAAADAKFEGLSNMIATEMNGIFGRLASKQRDDLVGLVNDFFTPTKSSPFMVARARAQIIKEDPQLWNDMVRVYFAQALNAARKQEAKGAGNNVLWNLHKNLWKDETQRKIMQSALTPQQFERFSSLMEQARLVGIAPNIGSATEPRQALSQTLRDQAQGAVATGIKMVRALNWLESAQAAFSERTYRALISDLTDTFMRVGGIEDISSMVERSAKRKAVTGVTTSTIGNVGEAGVSTMFPESSGIPNGDMNSDPQQGLGLQP